MKPVLLALAGMSIYAVTGVVIEQRLEKFTTASLVLLFTLPMVPIAALWLAYQKTHGGIVFPKGWALALTLILGAVYFFGDYFYLGAFTSGGNVLVISTIAIMAPVLTAIIRNVWVGGWPNAWQIGGYALAACAVLLLAHGNGVAAK
jgi:drug/metabolite transporter (DMT)-like permease